MMVSVCWLGVHGEMKGDHEHKDRLYSRGKYR